MGIFNFFGDQEHKVFDYKPMYYDKDKEELRRKFGRVDGGASAGKTSIGGKEASAGKGSAAGKGNVAGKANGGGKEGREGYVPGSYIKGSMRGGNYQKTRSSSNRAQNIIGIIGLLLVAVVLFYIAKFYTLL